MSQFKQGDLALVVGCFNDPRNIGATCVLVKWVEAGQSYRMPNGKQLSAPVDAWFVEGEQIIGAYRDHRGRRIETPGFGIAAPRHLMPLRGDFALDQQQAKAVSA